MTIDIPNENDLRRPPRPGRPPLMDVKPVVRAADEHPDTGIVVRQLPEHRARSLMRQLRRMGGYQVSQRRVNENYLDVFVKPEQA